jgi:hypothetical protein
MALGVQPMLAWLADPGSVACLPLLLQDEQQVCTDLGMLSRHTDANSHLSTNATAFKALDSKQHGISAEISASE